MKKDSTNNSERPDRNISINDYVMWMTEYIGCDQSQMKF